MDFGTNTWIKRVNERDLLNNSCACRSRPRAWSALVCRHQAVAILPINGILQSVYVTNRFCLSRSKSYEVVSLEDPVQVLIQIASMLQHSKMGLHVHISQGSSCDRHNPRMFLYSSRIYRAMNIYISWHSNIILYKLTSILHATLDFLILILFQLNQDYKMLS